MPAATVRLVHRFPDGDPIGPSEINCAVRVRHQGHASVELCTDGLGIFGKPDFYAPTWQPLETVLRHPDVRAVTFRGPWSDDPAGDSADEWRVLGTTDDSPAKFTR